MQIERGDSVAGFKRCRSDLSGDGVMDLTTASGHGRLKEDLESSTIECARLLHRQIFFMECSTRLYRHVMEMYPHLDNGIYDIVDRVMRPIALKQTRRPRSDRGKARHSISSSSSSSSRHVISSTR
ncbi:hypothetical protein Tco_0526331 [Tanacetum coccineum]